jgi:uncharacterized small protein (DUF1192 family)
MDEEPPRLPPNRPVDLAPLSIAELNELIEDHEREIARIRAAITAKSSIRSGADALFKR